MKKIKLLFPLLILTCQLSFAGVVTEEEAQQKATVFLQQRSRSAIVSQRANTAAATVSENKASASANYYVFNIGETEGFVVVSSDDRTPDILGYADQGAFDASEMPENMKAWLQSYTDQLAYLKQHDDAAVRRAPQLDEHKAIRPLLSSTWDQGAPYNNQCPMDGSYRSVTGCVATAMAQVLYYHKYPAKTIATIPGYTTETNKTKVSSIGITTINWSNMQDYYTGYESSTKKTAVATLMKLCGASVKMDYTYEGSAAYSEDVPKALIKYFDYDAATTLKYRDYYRAADWDNLIYSELENKRPVYYSGSSAGGGHAFVIDGYDKEGLYHVNWGWGGSADGYFLLSILDPGDNSGIGASSSTDGYSFGQSALLGAQPNTGVVPEVEVKMYTSSILTEQDSIQLTAQGYPVSLTAGIYNSMTEDYAFEIGLGVYNNKNELLSAKCLYANKEKILSGWGWNSIELQTILPALPDGIYQLVPISREYKTETWYKNENSEQLFITAKVKDEVMTLHSPCIDLTSSMITEGNYQVGSKINTITTIINNGTLFMDQLYLLVDGEIVGGRYFELDFEESDTLMMSYTPQETGSTKLEVGYYTYRYLYDKEEWIEEFQSLGTKTINIQSAKSYSLTFSNGKVTNAKNGTINDTKASLQFRVKNNGNYEYYDEIIAYALSEGNNGYYYIQSASTTTIKVSAGKTNTVSMDVPLNSDGNYWFLITYKTNGEFIDLNDDRCYGDMYGYRVTIPEVTDGIDNIRPSSTVTQIYDLSGHRLTKLRKGLNIVNGKKVFVK